MLLVSSNYAVRHGGESALHHFSQSMCWEVEGHWDSSITRSRRSSREDRVDAPVCCVTQQGQGSCVEVKGMTAKQPVKAALEFLNNLSNLMEHWALGLSDWKSDTDCFLKGCVWLRVVPVGRSTRDSWIRFLFNKLGKNCWKHPIYNSVCLHSLFTRS